MFISKRKLFATISLSILLLSGLFVIPQQKTAHAVGGVWVDTSFDFHAIMDNQKNFVWDRLATLFAKQLLHQMTASVVNWINSGFQGSPAFLTNPEGFFLDVADQFTGQFIAPGGPLSKLCSPFSIDIRLALALDQTLYAKERYTCTLGKIVSNAQGTMEGFTNGDFRQGGWPAFISLTTQPTNNAMGSYLQAHSELLSGIGIKKEKVNLDLNRGQGFLSWPKCTDLNASDVQNSPDYLGINSDQVSSLNAAYTQGKASINTGAGTSYTATVLPDGTLKYQDCHTETPGSVISGLLGKQLSGPATELELADNINAVVNALVSQMVTQVLSGGLHALSSSGSGGKPSYTAQVIQDLNRSQTTEVQNAGSQLSTVFDPAVSSLTEYKSLYDQGVAALSSSRANYQAARACFATSTRGGGSQNQIDRIDRVVTTQIDPLLAQLATKQADAANKIAQIQNSKSQVTVTTSGVQSQLPSYQVSVQNAIDANAQAASNMTTAKKELADVQTQVLKFNADAADFQRSCSRQ